MRTPEEAVQEFILAYEGNKTVGYLSMDPIDSGNWYKGKLIGSNYGVTGEALAKYRGVSKVTKAMMKAVSLEEAVSIGVKNYYEEPGFNWLPWVPPTEAWVDHGWLSGPTGAVMLMQEMLATAADGVVGPWTQAAYDSWLVNGLAKCCRDVYDVRVAHFHRIVARAPIKRKYLNGWIRRAAGFTDANETWWEKWHEDIREVPDTRPGEGAGGPIPEREEHHPHWWVRAWSTVDAWARNRTWLRSVWR